MSHTYLFIYVKRSLSMSVKSETAPLLFTPFSASGPISFFGWKSGPSERLGFGVKRSVTISLHSLQHPLSTYESVATRVCGSLKKSQKIAHSIASLRLMPQLPPNALPSSDPLTILSNLQLVCAGISAIANRLDLRSKLLLEARVLAVV
jgi:hypothetical protein